jgi:NAD(P)-dependent dehydrogenase (short-subunit alcohol dehydrogenase family)
MAAPWRIVWLTGASSGIGRELALELARRGVRVAASARSVEGLTGLEREADLIRAYPLDVTDAAATRAVVGRIEAELGPIDLAILNAGLWHPMSARELDIAKVEDGIRVNYLAMVYALDALLPVMRPRRSGHIAMVASVAGYFGLPRAIAYSPGKAAVINLAETLSADLARDGLKVSVINPGFVDTPMTRRNDFAMPFMLPADDAARRILAGLQRGRFEIAFPWQMVALLKTMRALPHGLRLWLQRRGMGA